MPNAAEMIFAVEHVILEEESIIMMKLTKGINTDWDFLKEDVELAVHICANVFNVMEVESVRVVIIVVVAEQKEDLIIMLLFLVWKKGLSLDI